MTRRPHLPGRDARARALVAAPIALLALGSGDPAASAAEAAFAATGLDLHPRDALEVRLDGYFRLRGELLYDLDLDRGLTPSGRPLFPVPLASPSAQTLTHADGRMRFDLAVYPPRFGVALKVRVDLLDNLALGSTPEGSPPVPGAPAPAFSPGQLSPAGAIRLKRAWAEALTPFGLLSAGRMGAHWGLGLVAHGGDCLDCDGSGAADRVQFVTPIAGLLWAGAFDFSVSGPFAARRAPTRAIDLDPTDDVRTITFAVLRWRDEAARDRRRAAGKATFEWGAFVSHRWQENDVPADYLSIASPAPIDPSAVMARGYRATALDVWGRVTTPVLRLEVELAALFAHVDQPSLVPGVLLPDPLLSAQFGAALETELGRPEGALSAGLDLGVASGDPASGFGAFPTPGAPAAAPGELDGPQAVPPFDARADNFRFNPDYRIDRILFREIVGTVTDAFYVRPHGRWRLFEAGPSSLTASVAAIGSAALYPASTPGGKSPLGIEIDPTLTYASLDGFVAALEYAVLFPLAGLDNPAEGLRARPAQFLRLRLAYVF